MTEPARSDIMSRAEYVAAAQLASVGCSLDVDEVYRDPLAASW